MMRFDANRDGKLTRAEITDSRLLGLFDRADANRDGVVTKEELQALYAKENSFQAEGPLDRGGPGGPGGPPGRPPGPEPGQVLPERIQQMLQLTPRQQAALKELQHEVDVKLDKLLTDTQKAQLKELKQRGPGGFMRNGEGPGPPHGPDRPPR